MSRGSCTFKQQDLVRALKGARAAGLQVDRIEIEKDGKIIISTPRGSNTPLNSYDTWKAKRDAS